MTERTFGVEIEHGNPKLSMYEVGVKLAARYPEWYKVVADGSGIEVVGPVLKGEDGIAEMKEVLAYLKSIGGQMDPKKDGLHVHHHAPELLDDKEGNDRIIRLLTSWAANQKTINLCLPDWRNNNPNISLISFCQQVNTGWVNLVSKSLASPALHGQSTKNKCGGLSRWYTLNVAALYEHDTVEIRQHHGTFNGDRAAAWVRFGQGFIERTLADTKPIKGYHSLNGLFKACGLDTSDISHLQKEAA